MDAIEAIYSRRAIREYREEPINHATIKTLIDAAIQAPSAIDLEPWAFSVVDEPTMLRWISKIAKAHLLEKLDSGSPLFALRPRLEDPKFDLLYGAPALITVLARSDAPQAAEDCCLAGQNLMLAACATGLGTCCIGLARPWLNTPEAKAELLIPKTYVAVLPIIVGHPKIVPQPRGRRHAELHWA
jgi:nitroreductase